MTSFILPPQLMPIIGHLPNFIVWKYRLFDNGKKVTKTKVPYTPGLGECAKPGVAETWRTLIQVQQALWRPKKYKQYDGAGFMFPTPVVNGKQLVVIDLDGKGDLLTAAGDLDLTKPGAKLIHDIEAYADSLTELSPSGLQHCRHVFGLCDADQVLRIGGRKAVMGAVDVFGNGGYCTLTCNFINDAPVRDLTKLVKFLLDLKGVEAPTPEKRTVIKLANGVSHEEHHQPTSNVVYPVDPRSPDELITQIGKNSDKFVKLMHDPKDIAWLIKTFPHPEKLFSHSGADRSLCGYIGAYTHDRDLALAVFRRSGLYDRSGDGSKRPSVYEFDHDYLLKNCFGYVWKNADKRAGQHFVAPS